MMKHRFAHLVFMGTQGDIFSFVHPINSKQMSLAKKKKRRKKIMFRLIETIILPLV